MIRSLVILILSVTSQANNNKSKWQSFKTKFSKNYSSPSEEAQRFSIFSANLDRITLHNKNSQSSQLGINKFTDLTREEILSQQKLGDLPYPEEDSEFECPEKFHSEKAFPIGFENNYCVDGNTIKTDHKIPSDSLLTIPFMVDDGVTIIDISSRYS